MASNSRQTRRRLRTSFLGPEKAAVLSMSIKTSVGRRFIMVSVGATECPNSAWSSRKCRGPPSRVELAKPGAGYHHGCSWQGVRLGSPAGRGRIDERAGEKDTADDISEMLSFTDWCGIDVRPSSKVRLAVDMADLLELPPRPACRRGESACPHGPTPVFPLRQVPVQPDPRSGRPPTGNDRFQVPLRRIHPSVLMPLFARLSR